MNGSIRDDVVSAVVEVCGIEAAQLQDSADLESLNIDSLDLIEVAMLIEEKYPVELSGDHFEGVTTFGETVAVIERQALAQS